LKKKYQTNIVLSDSGEHPATISVEIFYFGIPKTTVRIVGIEQTNQITQVGVRLICQWYRK
jgi:hypothetical protein